MRDLLHMCHPNCADNQYRVVCPDHLSPYYSFVPSSLGSKCIGTVLSMIVQKAERHFYLSGPREALKVGCKDCLCMA